MMMSEVDIPNTGSGSSRNVAREARESLLRSCTLPELPSYRNGGAHRANAYNEDKRICSRLGANWADSTWKDLEPVNGMMILGKQTLIHHWVTIQHIRFRMRHLVVDRSEPYAAVTGCNLVCCNYLSARCPYFIHCKVMRSYGDVSEDKLICLQIPQDIDHCRACWARSAVLKPDLLTRLHEVLPSAELLCKYHFFCTVQNKTTQPYGASLPMKTKAIYKQEQENAASRSQEEMDMDIADVPPYPPDVPEVTVAQIEDGVADAADEHAHGREERGVVHERDHNEQENAASRSPEEMDVDADVPPYHLEQFALELLGGETSFSCHFTFTQCCSEEESDDDQYETLNNFLPHVSTVLEDAVDHEATTGVVPPAPITTAALDPDVAELNQLIDEYKAQKELEELVSEDYYMEQCKDIAEFDANDMEFDSSWIVPMPSDAEEACQLRASMLMTQIEPHGLFNEHNTCYVNSPIQFLLQCRILIAFVQLVTEKWWDVIIPTCPTRGVVFRAFCTLVRNYLENPGNHTFSCETFIDKVSAPTIAFIYCHTFDHTCSRRYAPQ